MGEIEIEVELEMEMEREENGRMGEWGNDVR